ncbi:MAG: hypothetical protein COV29_03380 [Candidatus Yanofskybacteria bacterium CG10_big_fil_rev_8_21_14_0_10_36_16]|uniref:Carrier domain-containing protein n=1 Tax=Candidatus Yanofskybacteria bacterium CG10_big_fil_rev_8_21_14_0_10_36_16 TaxID=1975096 RepID=A0A2J0Q714_9BACT|nr:MAG: hypothetical protein COV29_03380 [Candidatus Yanofskybacteria bacterium CG10_big_fil_rev_8_21_14_0_10_36_16]
MNPEDVYSVFESIANKYPNDLAIIHGSKNISYRELWHMSCVIGKELSEANDNNLVAIYMRECPEYIATMFGCLGVGRGYVPVSTSIPSNRLRQVIRHTGCKVIITDEDGYSKLNSSEIVKKTRIIVINKNGLINDAVVKPKASNDEGTIATVIFTSGSTGKPKAVALSHGVILNHVKTWLNTLGNKRERMVLLSSLSFSLSMTTIFVPLLRGGTVIIPDFQWLSDLNKLSRFFEEYKITCLKLVPSLFRRLSGVAIREPDMFSSLKAVILSGEPADCRSVLEFKKHFKSVRIFNTYGLTEAFSFSSYEVRGDEHFSDNAFLPVGKATPGNVVKILSVDKKNKKSECSQSEEGAVFVGGQGLFSGYIKKGVVVGPRLLGKDNLFKTGDSGFIDGNGDLIVCGRYDLMFKINGLRIDPEEVEKFVLMYSGIIRAVAFKAVHNGSDFLICLIEKEDDVSIGDLKKFLEYKVPDYLIPKMFIETKIPVLVSEKIDRKKIASSVWIKTENTPLRINDSEATTSVKIANIWKDILGIHEIDSNTSFSDAGGDSLNFIDMLFRIEELFGVRIPSISSDVTIGQTVKLIDAENDNFTCYYYQRDNIVCGAFPISDIREIIFSSNYLKTDNLRGSKIADLTISQKRRIKKINKAQFDHTYVQIRFNEEVDEIALSQALRVLISRHDALRSSLLIKEGKIVVNFFDLISTRIPYMDLSDLDLDINSGYATSQLAFLPFEIGKYPMFRWVLIKRGHNSYDFVWQLSHLLVDLVSGDLLASELIRLYESFSQKNDALLPKKLFTSEDLNQDLESIYYPEEILNYIKVLIKEYYVVVDEIKTKIKKSSNFECEGNMTQSFLKELLPADISVYDLLAKYAIALHKWTGFSKIPLRIGTPGRNYPALSFNYLRNLVAQANDHFMFVVDLSRESDQDEVSHQISEKINWFVKNSVHFDKVLDCVEKNDPLFFKGIDSGHLFSSGPLGSVSVNSAKSIAVASIPRPLWGINSFHPLSSGMKIGLFSFLDNGRISVHLHAKGISDESFNRFISIF